MTTTRRGLSVPVLVLLGVQLSALCVGAVAMWSTWLYSAGCAPGCDTGLAYGNTVAFLIIGAALWIAAFVATLFVASESIRRWTPVVGALATIALVVVLYAINRSVLSS